MRSRGAGEPGPFPGPSPAGAPGRKLFIDAQALSKVPSTEKCSALRSPFTSGRPSSEDRNSCAISWVSRRSRFFEKVERRTRSRRSQARRTSETTGRTPAVRPAAAPSGSKEKLQKRGPQEALRRDRGTPDSLVKCRKPRVELGQRRIGQPPHRPQRMVRRDARLDVDVREQRPARPILALHRSPRESPRRRLPIMPQWQTPEPFRATSSARCWAASGWTMPLSSGSSGCSTFRRRSYGVAPDSPHDARPTSTLRTHARAKNPRGRLSGWGNDATLLGGFVRWRDLRPERRFGRLARRWVSTPSGVPK